jgi:hypothetical protein
MLHKTKTKFFRSDIIALLSLFSSLLFSQPSCHRREGKFTALVNHMEKKKDFASFRLSGETRRDEKNQQKEENKE